MLALQVCNHYFPMHGVFLEQEWLQHTWAIIVAQIIREEVANRSGLFQPSFFLLYMFVCVLVDLSLSKHLSMCVESDVPVLSMSR